MIQENFEDPPEKSGGFFFFNDQPAPVPSTSNEKRPRWWALESELIELIELIEFS